MFNNTNKALLLEISKQYNTVVLIVPYKLRLQLQFAG